MPRNGFILNKRNFSNIFLISILCITILLTSENFNINNTQAHSPEAIPMEIFSIWNDTAPTIDGTIGFTSYRLTGEWSSAAVYNLFSLAGLKKGKLIIQNDNNNLYVAIDCITFLEKLPSLRWGANLYFDLDHNGWLSSSDYWVTLENNSGIASVYLRRYSESSNSWQTQDSGLPGDVLTDGIVTMIAETGFAKSAFNNLTEHRQYEFKFEYSSLAIPSINDKLIGFAVEATPHLISDSYAITWPIQPLTTKFIEDNPGRWGDLHLGDQFFSEDYIIEDNFYIKDGAGGYENNTVLITADINGDGDQELVVTSNRQVAGDENLIAIFDYIDGEITRIWASWESAHYGSLFHITGMAAYDFDEDGKDELYGVSFSDSRIGRFVGWNNVTRDFDTAEIIFDNYGDFLLGYIAIGDASNKFDGSKQILFGDEIGWIGVLDYKWNKDEFELLGYIAPFQIGGVDPYRIHAIEVTDMDSDGWNEIIFNAQTSSDNSLSETQLQIIELDGTSYYDNPSGHYIYGWEDDLPVDSHINTQDFFGHTIIVEDVDNDGEIETIIVGKEYVKIFGQFNFNDSQIPLEFAINDGADPNYGGGAGDFDIDGDFYNELVFGCSNGTVVIYEITNNDPDPYEKDLVYTEEWRADIGAAPGLKNSIIGYDIDKDGDMEIILGDQFGQIMVIGKGNLPSVSITSPSFGYVSNKENLLIKWSISNESNPMEFYDIWVNGAFETRMGGGQLGSYITLDFGPNDIELYDYDVLGNLAYDYIYVEYTQNAPEVSIYHPENYFMTQDDNVTVKYLAFDPDYDPITYYIYRNGTNLTPTGITATEYDVLLPSEGIFNITVVAEDDSMNKGKDTIFVIRDNTGPTINIISPLSGSAVNVDFIDLWWESYDELTDVDHFDVYRDNVYQGTSYTNYFGLALPNDKKYTIRVEAFDVVGNYQPTSIQITRDTLDPTVELLPLSLPTQSGWYYTDEPLQFIEWDGFDNAGGTGIEWYGIYINSELYDMYGSTFLNDTIDLGEEGFKEILIYAWDKAGNFGYDYYTIALDASDPMINITSPYNGYVTSEDTIVVTWTSDDAGTGIKEHIIYVNDTYIDTIDSSEFFYMVDIPLNDTYIITVEAIDYLDRVAEDSINVIHDFFAPTFSITTPYDYTSYSSSTVVNVTWETFNIFTDEFYVFVNDTLYGTYDSSTFSVDVDLEVILGEIPISQFPLANITATCFIGGEHQFIDTKLVIVDQSLPSLAILEPSNASIIINEDLYVQWSAYDTGSGIAGFRIWLNGDFIGTFGKTVTSQFIDISSYDDGWHTLTIETFDAAGNTINKSIQLELFPQAPEFSINIDTAIITNDPNFDLNITVYNPRIGVSEVQVVADGEEVVYFIDYGTDYQYDPFWLNTTIDESVFTALGDHHNLTITVYDKVDRGRNMIVEIIIDIVNPTIYYTPILGSTVLYPTGNVLELSDDPNENIFNLSINARDTYGISTIFLTISGDGYNETFEMNFDPDQSVSDIYAYYYTLNLTELSEGNYTIQFEIYDNAGNSISSSYDLQIQMHENPIDNPQNSFLEWLMDHLYTIVIPSAAGLLLLIILPTILVVATKKRRLNKGWQESLEAVAYVTKTGLTLAYVPYSRDLFDDEQLFGGAMTGIMSILGEITGEKDVEMQVHILEFGDKRLLVCPGYFGNAILLVNDVKPKLKELLPKFLMDFEITYKANLTQDLIDLNEFAAVPLLVESIFGFRKEFFQQQNIEQHFESTDEYYQEY
ncbi:MAG: hypothetical protein FK731_02355 [Asgard group archaeon]|nr:hypothetical protein [Asgard group archaeon]